MSYYNGHGLPKPPMNNFDDDRFPERGMSRPGPHQEELRMGGRAHYDPQGPPHGPPLSRGPYGFEGAPNMNMNMNMLSLGEQQRMGEQRLSFPPHQQHQHGLPHLLGPGPGPGPAGLAHPHQHAHQHAQQPPPLGFFSHMQNVHNMHAGMPMNAPNAHVQYSRPASVKETVSVPPELSVFASEPKFAQIILRVKEQTNANFISLQRGGPDGSGAVEKVNIDAMSAEAAELAKNLIETHLKLQMKIKAAENRLQQVQTEFFSAQGEIAAGHVSEFAVRPELLGLTIGKGGARIKQIEKDTGVTSINVENSGKIAVYGPDATSVQRAREQLELFEDSYPLADRHAAWLAERSNSSTLADFRTDCKLMVAKLNRDNNTLELVGTASALQKAKYVWATQQEYLDHEISIKESERETAEKLSAMRKQYGMPRGKDGHGPRDRERGERDNHKFRGQREREKERETSAVSQTLFKNVSASLGANTHTNTNARAVDDPLDALISDRPQREKDRERDRANEKSASNKNQEKDGQRGKTGEKQKDNKNKDKAKEKEKEKEKESDVAPLSVPAGGPAPVGAPPGLKAADKSAKDNKDNKDNKDKKEKDKQPMLVKINNPFLAEQDSRRRKSAEQDQEKESREQTAADSEKTQGKSRGRAKDKEKEKEKEREELVIPPSQPLPVSGPPALPPSEFSLVITPPSAELEPDASENNNTARKRGKGNNKPKDKDKEKEKEKEKEKNSEKDKESAPGLEKNKVRKERATKKNNDGQQEQKKKDGSNAPAASASEQSKESNTSPSS